MIAVQAFVSVTLLAATAFAAGGDHPYAARGVTSLTNPQVRYTRPEAHFIEVRRGPITAVIVDNHAVDSPQCPKHRAGYSGIAVLRHAGREGNLFLPGVAGLNFEHIHDGTLAVERELFEPRKARMELRRVSDHVVELYQPPTPNFQLESCGRYEVLEDGTIEYTFECIPRAKRFAYGYVGLFWASYIDRPESTATHFRGVRLADDRSGQANGWIEARSPEHGVASAHRPVSTKDEPLPKHDPRFPLTLVFNTSNYAYSEPWYYGLSRGMAYVQMFPARSKIWFAQSPTGGGGQHPAWDFQWFIPDYQVGQAYGFQMRAAYVPAADSEALAAKTRAHREALNKN